MKRGGKRAVFLDRDGTVIEDTNYLSSPSGVRLLPGAGEAIARFNQAGLAVVVVTNQSGLGRGYFNWETVERIHAELDRRLAAHGAGIDAFFVCPHSPKDPVACTCRKPAPGLILRAAEEMGLDLEASFMIGDRLRDVACAHAGGCTAILVATGQDDGAPITKEEAPEHRASGLQEAADWILSRLEG